MGNPLRAILSFHLKNSREYTDENAVIEKITEDEIILSSNKPYKVTPGDLTNATIMILHGNSSRVLFSVDEMKDVPEIRKIEGDAFPRLIYSFLPPQPKTVPCPGGDITVPCSGYSKLQAIMKPKNLKAQERAA